MKAAAARSAAPLKITPFSHPSNGGMALKHALRRRLENGLMGQAECKSCHKVPNKQLRICHVKKLFEHPSRWFRGAKATELERFVQSGARGHWSSNEALP